MESSSRRLFHLFICLIALLSLAAGHLQAADLTVTLVSLDDSGFPALTLRLNIVDSTGRPVTGLTAGAFQVLEDGDPAEIVSVRDVADSESGLAVVLVIDVSDSMGGAPLAAAKQSATAFIQSLGPNDEVAVLAFGSSVREVQSFTADKQAAQSAIDSLQLSGTTALYDAANQGVLTASRSALARRMVVLIGDGAEFGGASLSGPEDAYEAARARGITIHTIALGFGADKAYLQQLAGLTGGVALEAPEPDELNARLSEISTLMRQVVEVVVNSGVPGDGQPHALLVRVTTGGSQAEVTTTFRSQSVAPVVNVNAPAGPIRSLTTITANVTAQGQIASVAFAVDGTALSRDADSPFTADLDPAAFAAGPHTLTVEATDETGATGSTEITFEVAAVPPSVSLSLAEGQTVDALTSVTAEVVSQTKSNEVSVSVDGAVIETLAAAPYRFTLDPAAFDEGAHTLTVSVTDANGQTAAAEAGFTIVKAASPGASSALPIAIGAGVGVVALLGAAFVALRRKPAPSAPPAAAMRLEVLTGPDKGKTLVISETRQVIGRLSTASLPLADPSGALHISREHARVWKEGATAYVEDAGSRYGTFVNGQRVTGATALTHAALLKVGEIEIAFHGPAPTAGDLRATRFEPGVVPTMIAPAAKAPAAQPDQTRIADDDEDEVRRTQLKDEPQSQVPGAVPVTPVEPTVISPQAGDSPPVEPTMLAPTEGPPPIEPTMVSPETGAPPLERTMLAPESGDEPEDELRHTRRAEEPKRAADDEEDIRHTRLKPGGGPIEGEDDLRRTRRKSD